MASKFIHKNQLDKYALGISITIELFHHVIINDVAVNCRTRAYLLVYKLHSALIMEVCRLSAYANSLSEKRYKDKISMIGGLDPYLGSLGECAGTTPPVEASDLVSYLVLQTSFLTAEQFKAHKGLESYN